MPYEFPAGEDFTRDEPAMKITVLGIGNIMMTDDGFGVRVVERLRQGYRFEENVTIVDGHILGVNLVPLVAASDCLIVVDTVRHGEKPGFIYRLEGAALETNPMARRGIHEIDFLDVMVLCRSLGVCPKTIVFGVEPADIKTVGNRLTPRIERKVDEMMRLILKALQSMDISYQQKEADHVPCDTVKSHSNRKRLRSGGNGRRAP